MEKKSNTERSNVLLKIANVIEENANLFALQETLNNGKPIRETKGAGREHIFWEKYFENLKE